MRSRARCRCCRTWASTPSASTWASPRAGSATSTSTTASTPCSTTPWPATATRWTASGSRRSTTPIRACARRSRPRSSPWSRSTADTPGLLMWLLGNENNYGLTWSSFEIEALPEGERDAARARHLYSLFGEITDEIQRLDATTRRHRQRRRAVHRHHRRRSAARLDVFGTNVYRGISARDLFDVVQREARRARAVHRVRRRRLQRPHDARGPGDAGALPGGPVARDLRADRPARAAPATPSAASSSSGATAGGSSARRDRLDIHDTHASWPNGGYVEDFVEGENNMNEEWWGITAKGAPDHRGLYDGLPPRRVLRAAPGLHPRPLRVRPPTSDAIRAHFADHPPGGRRGGRPAATAPPSRPSRTSASRRAGAAHGVRDLQHGRRAHRARPRPRRPASPPSRVPGLRPPAVLLRGRRGQPRRRTSAAACRSTSWATCPTNPIDEIFYENRGRARTVRGRRRGRRARVARAREGVPGRRSAGTTDWFQLDAFYRTGHLHWGHEGDFFGLYRNAYYGENIDIYNGMAPIGLEIAGKRRPDGPQAGLRPAALVGRQPRGLPEVPATPSAAFAATMVYHEDVAAAAAVTSSHRHSAARDSQGLAAGRHARAAPGPWSSAPSGRAIPRWARPSSSSTRRTAATAFCRTRSRTATPGASRARSPSQHGALPRVRPGRLHGPGRRRRPHGGHHLHGLEPEGLRLGQPEEPAHRLHRQTGRLPDRPRTCCGRSRSWARSPATSPRRAGRATSLDDPFAVRGNRETVGAEMLIACDPTPATWMWAWDNDVARGRPPGRQPRLRLPRPAVDAWTPPSSSPRTAPPPTPSPARRRRSELWEVRTRIVSRLGRADAPGGQPLRRPGGTERLDRGYRAGAAALNRIIHRYGAGCAGSRTARWPSPASSASTTGAPTTTTATST